RRDRRVNPRRERRNAEAQAQADSLASVPDDFDDFNLDEMPEFLRVLEETAVPELEQWLEAPTLQTSLADRRYDALTEEDYREVAHELGIEVAAIKAVVVIEAGPRQRGFHEPGKPIINFDAGIYRQFAPRHGVSLKKARKAHPEIFERPDPKRHGGSTQAAQHARLEAACSINRESALKSTFWGMFQIGGFNWKKCGTQNVEEFVSRMSRSERDQLELFAAFIRNNGMLQAIKKKQWLKFALIYNGPKAKARGYHTRLAKAYKEFGGK
ncbi:MAG: N-acetylmuramidase family protein, partial [Muribaculaceae bacterium]|nr:N-acetylmuramidase family protein [Muribaculaceae bacterium]